MDDQSKSSSNLPEENSHSSSSDGSKSHEQETGNSDKAGACTVNQDNDKENNPVLRQRATVSTDKAPENDQNLQRSNNSQQASSPNSSINNSANSRDQRTTGDYRAQPAAMHPVVNNDMTENIHRFQIRCVLFLCLAVGLGYLYLQLENQSMLGKPRLFPGPNYAAFEGKSLKQSSHNKIKSSPTPAPPPIPKSTPTEDDPPQPIETDFSKQPPQKPMIDPNYEIQAKYLSKVLTTLGDLSRKMELNDNITKPIGGIIEMRTEVIEPPEEKEEVPEYLKRLGTIIDDIKVKKEKDRAVRREEQLKANAFRDQAAKKSKLEIEKARIEKSKRKEKLKLKREKQKKQEWDKFMDDLLEAVYEEEQAERKVRGEKEPQKFNSRSRDDMDDMDDDEDDEYDDDDDIDEDDVVIDLRSETEKNKKSRSEQPNKIGLGDVDFETREHFMRIRHNLGYGLRGNSRLDEMDEVDSEDEEVDEDLDDELYQELEDEEADEPPSIFSNNKEIQGGMALLQVMLEARNEAKAAKQAEEDRFDKKSSKSNTGYDTEKNRNSARRPKLKFEDDNMFTL